MKIVNFKKFLRGMCLILITVLIILLLISKASLSYNTKNYKTMYVTSGDTLWSIALSLQNIDYYNGKDVRYIISDIKELNNLKSSDLSIGEALIIPTI